MNNFSQPFPQDKWIDEAARLRERVAQLESALDTAVYELETEAHIIRKAITSKSDIAEKMWLEGIATRLENAVSSAKL